MTDCDALPTAYPGQSVREIPTLIERLDEVSRDVKRWVRVFRCRNCGQLWEESYETTGHGENANTRKVPQA